MATANANISDYDKFGVELMNAEEHRKGQAYVTEKCKCQTCPNYVEGDSPIGYCFPLNGTSKKIHWENEDCCCESCPIYQEYGLDHHYFCTRCSQFCQSFKLEEGGGHE